MLGGGAAAGAVASIVIASHLGAALDNPAAVASSLLRIAGYAACTAILVARMPGLIPGGVAALGVYLPRGRQLAAIAGGVAIAAGLRYLTYWYLVLLRIPDHVQTGLEHFAVTSPLSGILVVGVGVVAAPFAEELFFRGVAYNALAVPLSPARAALASGLLFAASRGDIAMLPYFTAYGTLLAILYRRSGNLAVPMVVRAIVDGGSTVLLVWLDAAAR